MLLPVRDGAAWLGEAITSLDAQTDGDFEVVAVDDGSTDGTPDILADWARADARVRVVRQEAAGIVTALERGRALARGRWLARMDADDVSEPGRFAAQRALMESDARLAACGTHVRYFPRSALRAGARRYEAWLNAKAFARALAEAGVAVRAFVEVDPRKIGQEIHGAPVLDTAGGLALEGPLHVAAVGRAGARRRLRDLLSDSGMREMADFVAVA